jgi:hypothetical protein
VPDLLGATSQTNCWVWELTFCICIKSTRHQHSDAAASIACNRNRIWLFSTDSTVKLIKRRRERFVKSAVYKLFFSTFHNFLLESFQLTMLSAIKHLAHVISTPKVLISIYLSVSNFFIANWVTPRSSTRQYVEKMTRIFYFLLKDLLSKIINR